MGETYDAVRDRDENNKPEALDTVTISKFHDHNPIVGALNASLSLSTSLNSDSNSSSKSSSPDHVVPSQKAVNSPHRLSTSSGASSPQTDGSISISYRRPVGSSHLSPDASHNGLCAAEAASDHGRNVVTAISTKRKVGSARKTKKVRSKIGRTKKATKSREQDIEEDSDTDYVIRCICGFSDMFDKQIQCEQCEVWQHFGCMGIEPATVPDCYLCEVCDPLTFRPLRHDEARELHRSLMPRDNQLSGSTEIPKNKNARRKKSADTTSIPPTTPTPRQPDLIQSDKKRVTTSETRSRQSSVETVLKSTHRTDDCGELSRDDRKILQYEQMFKRMEERRDKKEKRKRTHDENSLGSPTRESTKEREHLDDESHQSHGESTNPPPSPPFASIIDFPPPLPTSSDPIVINEQFAAPASTSAPISTPVKISLKAKRFAYRAKSVVERYVEKDSPLPLPESPSSLSEKVESPTNVETPTTAVPTAEQKSRFSLRLRNNAVSRSTENGEENNARIELNSMKKRKKEGELMDDIEMGLPMVMLPLNKRKIRTVSFIDAYYSSMADMQTETDMQKATRRNRAYSASEEFEQIKFTAERCRLYRLYGLKKAVFARYKEEDEPTLIPSTSECSSIADESAAQLKDLESTVRPLTQSCLARYGGVLPLKRSRTVRAMIEESMQKNRDEERAHHNSQTLRKECMASVKMESDIPKSDVLQRMMGQETAKNTARLPRSEKKSENVRLSVPDGSGLGAAKSADVLSKSASKTVQSSGGEVIATSQSTAQSAVPNEHTAPATKKPDEKLKESSVPAVPSPTVNSRNSLPVAPTKKLSLAEYRQWKAEMNRPVNSAASVAVPAVKVALPATLPPPSQPVSSSPAPAIPPARTSVIHRIGSVTPSNEPRTELPASRVDKPPPLPPPTKPEKPIPQRHTVKVSIPHHAALVGRLKPDDKTAGGKVNDGAFMPPPVPYVQTHFRPAPMLAARNSASSMADSMKSQLNMV